jgi:hypothetical protein
VPLFSFELRWADAIARAFVPADALGGSTAQVDVPALIAADWARSPWQANLLLRLALWMTWLSPVWLAGRPHFLGGLSAADREMMLERLLSSRVSLVRLPIFYLKLMAVSFLLGDRRALARIGAYRMLEVA